MRLILIFLSTLFLHSAQAQKTIEVCAQNQTLKVNLLDEDATKVLIIDATKIGSSKNLSVLNNNWKAEKDWKRSFSVYDDKDHAVMDIQPCKADGKYQVSLQDVIAKMSKGQTYTLYTMAIPRDPKKAALVRVRRVLVCRISIT